MLLLVIVIQAPHYIEQAQIAYPNIFGTIDDSDVKGKSSIDKTLMSSDEAFQFYFANEGDNDQIASEHCVLNSPFDSNSELSRTTGAKIKNVFRSAMSQGASIDELDLISHSTGFPILLSRFGFIQSQNFGFTQKYPNETVPLFDNQDWLDKINRQSLEFTLKIEALSPKIVIDGLKNENVKSNSIYVHGNTKTTLLGFLHANTPWLSSDVVIELLDAGYIPSLNDLAYFTAIDAEQELIERLWRAVDGDVSSVHKFPPFYQSLASIALVNGNFDSLKFWLEHDSPINPDPFRASALRALLNAQKRTAFTSEEETFIVKEIVKTKLSRTDISIISEMYENIIAPTEMISLINNSIELSYESKLVNRSVEEIKSIVLEPLSAKIANSVCEEQYVVNTVRNLLKQKFDEDKVKLEDKSLISSLSSDVQIFLSEISKSKSEQEALQREALEIRAKEIQANFDSEISEQDNITIQEIVSAAKRGDWDLAISLLESIEIVERDALNTLVSLAISSGADFDTLANLINLGGELSRATYFQLILSDNTVLAKSLIPYGLNVSESFLPNGDVIKDVVQYGSPEMLSLFLDNDVMVDFSIEGMDALDILLQRFSLKSEDVLFLQKIMASPVEVEVSHLSFVYELSKKSPAEFQYIADTYPKLVAFEQIVLQQGY